MALALVRCGNLQRRGEIIQLVQVIDWLSIKLRFSEDAWKLGFYPEVMTFRITLFLIFYQKIQICLKCNK